MVDRNQTKQALANLSGHTVRGFSMERLASRFAQVAVDRRAKEANYAARDTTPDAFVRHLRDKAAARLSAVSEKTSSHLPVTSVYDALQVAKQHKNANADAGIRAFTGMLNAMWKQDRTAKITASQFVKYREYYSANFPKSAIAEVLDTVGEKGYASLPVSELLKIARRINTQEDYDREIVAAGLHTKQPHHIKSREFIRSVINGASEVPNPFDQYDEQEEKFNRGRDEIEADWGEGATSDVIKYIKVLRGHYLYTEYENTLPAWDEEEEVPDYEVEVVVEDDLVGGEEAVYRLRDTGFMSAEDNGATWWETESTRGMETGENIHTSGHLRHADGSDLSAVELKLFDEMLMMDSSRWDDLESLNMADYGLGGVDSFDDPKTTKDSRQMALPHHIKSREFIRSVINGASEVPNPFDQYDEQEGEYIQRIEELSDRYGEDVVEVAVPNAEALLAEYQVTRIEADPGQEGGDPVDEDTQDMSFLGALEEIEEDAWEFGGRWWTSTDNQKVFGYDDGLQISVFIKHLDGSDLTQSEVDLFNQLRSEGAARLYVEVAEYVSDVKRPDSKTTKDPRQIALPHVGRRRSSSIKKHKLAAKKSIRKVNRIRRRAQEVDDFTRQAFETLVWSSHDVDEDGVEYNYDDATFEDLAAESQAKLADICGRFQSENADLLEEACYWTGNDLGQAAHDFILTMNGHGAGFWDGDWGTSDIDVDFGKELTEAAEKFPELGLERGDDGQLYIY